MTTMRFPFRILPFALASLALVALPAPSRAQDESPAAVSVRYSYFRAMEGAKRYEPLALATGTGDKVEGERVETVRTTPLSTRDDSEPLGSEVGANSTKLVDVPIKLHFEATLKPTAGRVYGTLVAILTTNLPTERFTTLKLTRTLSQETRIAYDLNILPGRFVPIGNVTTAAGTFGIEVQVSPLP